jgi:hypothetical protein
MEDLQGLRNEILELEVFLDNKEISRVGASNSLYQIRNSLDLIMTFYNAEISKIEKVARPHE